MYYSKFYYFIIHFYSSHLSLTSDFLFPLRLSLRFLPLFDLFSLSFFLTPFSLSLSSLELGLCDGDVVDWRGSHGLVELMGLMQ